MRPATFPIGAADSRYQKFERIDTDKLVDDIAGGVPVTIACAARGIHRDTFYKWLEDIRNIRFIGLYHPVWF